MWLKIVSKLHIVYSGVTVITRLTCLHSTDQMCFKQFLYTLLFNICLFHSCAHVWFLCAWSLSLTVPVLTVRPVVTVCVCVCVCVCDSSGVLLLKNHSHTYTCTHQLEELSQSSEFKTCSTLGVITMVCALTKCRWA